MNKRSILAVIAFAFAHYLHAETYLRPVVNYVDPSAKGSSSATGFGFTGGTYSGAHKEHDFNFEWGWVKYSAKAPGAAVDEYIMPYIFGYKYHIPASDIVSFYFGPGVGFTSDIIKAGTVYGNSESSKWAFSYAGSVGVRVRIGSQFDFDLGYRYLAIGSREHTLYGTRFNADSSHANVISAGLGFRF